MALSISAAARRWGVGRETIYRKKKAGELSFLDTKPPTIDPAEMLRVFGEPREKPDKDEAAAVATAPVRLEIANEVNRKEAERLKDELTAAKAELEKEREAARRERDEARAEREKLLDMLKEKETSQRLLEQKLVEINTPKPWWKRLTG